MIDDYVVIGFGPDEKLKIRVYTQNNENYFDVVSYPNLLSASAVLHSSIRKGSLVNGQVIKIKNKKNITKQEISQLYKLV
jgi:hypothetical protein